MELRIKELTPGFAAEAEGVELAAPLEDTAIEAIRDAIDRYAVLVFHDQPLNDEQQIAFSRSLGPLEITIRAGALTQPRAPEIADLSNIDKDGNLLATDSRKAIFDHGNEHWHTDSSFKPIPAKYSLLSAREIPPEGGETEFADARQAYDNWKGTPDGLTAADLEGLVCEHSIVYSRMVITGDLFDEKQKAELPPVRQALIRAHPATGRKIFYVGSHASHIIGWPVEKGRPLLRELTEWCTQPRFTHRHVWRRNDLVMWDNRSVLHRGRPFDRTRYRRVMYRTTLAGDGPTAPAAE